MIDNAKTRLLAALEFLDIYKNLKVHPNGKLIGLSYLFFVLKMSFLENDVKVSSWVQVTIVSQNSVLF